MKKTLLVLTVIFAFCILSALAITTTRAQTSGNSITLYAGSVTSGSGTYGYGDSASNIVSPGPTLNLVEGTTYTITVNNVANIPHSFEIVPTKAASESPLWNAGINIDNYISPGGSGSVTFTPNETGNFYYVCTVPGHITLGMWGNVVVSASASSSPTIPEFPSTVAVLFMVVATLSLVVYFGRKKIKPMSSGKVSRQF